LPLTSGTTVNSGSIYYYNGSGTLTGVTDNGGVILVCGTLTLSYPNMSSGTVVVETGGSLTILDDPHPVTNGTLAVQSQIVNYGTLAINALTSYTPIPINQTIWNYGNMSSTSSLTFNSYGLYNVNSTSNITVTGDMVAYGPVVNNGNIQDNGKFTFTSTICLGGGSDLSTDSLFEDGSANNVTVSPSPSGSSAGISVSQNYQSNYNSLTSTSSVVFCAGPHISPTIVTGNFPGNIGSATLEPNCTAVTLPVALLSFNAETGFNNACTLTWATSMESGLKDFDLEYSLNGSDFVSLAVIDAHGVGSTYVYDTQLKGKTWFRLKMENADGTYTYSPVVLADYVDEQPTQSYSIKIQPNCITNNSLLVWSNMATAQTGEWVVVDMTGRTVFRLGAQLTAGISNEALQLPSLASGMYHLLFVGSQVNATPVPFTVIR
jgi:hypothetical protein